MPRAEINAGSADAVKTVVAQDAFAGRVIAVLAELLGVCHTVGAVEASVAGHVGRACVRLAVTVDLTGVVVGANQAFLAGVSEPFAVTCITGLVFALVLFADALAGSVDAGDAGLACVK